MAKALPRQCRNCEFFKRFDGEDRPKPILRDHVYRCAGPLPDLATMIPEAYLTHHRFPKLGTHAVHTTADAGTACAVYKEWKRQ